MYILHYLSFTWNYHRQFYTPSAKLFDLAYLSSSVSSLTVVYMGLCGDAVC